MSFMGHLVTGVLIALVIQYMTGNKGKGSVASPDGMRMLYNPRQGNVVLALLGVIGAFMLFLGFLCFSDIGFGQGGVVMLFLLMGAGCFGLGFLGKQFSDRNRICFDEQRVIQYRAIGTRVEIEWWEVTEYSCDPRRTYLAAADGRKITVDYGLDGTDELIMMIQQKAAWRPQPAPTRPFGP